MQKSLVHPPVNYNWLPVSSVSTKESDKISLVLIDSNLVSTKNSVTRSTAVTIE